MSSSKTSTTMRAVAEKAGVSVATVSRVINTPDRVKAIKREKVIEAIKSLDYVPNPIAKALGSKKIRSLAIVVPTILNSFMAEVTRGIIEVLDESSFDALVFDSNESFEREQEFFEILPHKMIDGAIFIGGAGRDLDFSSLAERMPVALVARSEMPENVNAFIGDELQGMKRLIIHLVDLGHREIGLIAGTFNSTDGTRRFGMFKEALREEGLTWKPENCVAGDWTLEGGWRSMKKLLNKPAPPSAVVCATDIMAHGALGAAYDEGYHVPGDVSIVGFDNAPGSGYLVPPLTTLKYPNYRLGKLAANAVLNRLEDRDFTFVHKQLPLELLLRESSGPVPSTSGRIRETSKTQKEAKGE
ncbi:MAG: LacI family DNA-binding transcriptional regulator [Spirochaetia bacterium]